VFCQRFTEKQNAESSVKPISHLSDAAADNSFYKFSRGIFLQWASPNISGNHFILISIQLKQNDENFNRTEDIRKTFSSAFTWNIPARFIWTRKPCYFLVCVATFFNK